MGSLWASFFRELATPFRIGEKVGSRVPKELVLGALGAPFGRVLDDILEDLGCDSNIPSLGMP